jgi:hypothetical protein
MNKKMVSSVTFCFVLIVSSALILPSAYAVAPPNTTTVTINANGSITPSTAPIQRNGDVYTLTGNINSQIRLLKGNITLDGAGHTLHGPYNGTATWDVGGGPSQLPEGVAAQFSTGVDFGANNVKGVTIKNLRVENFSVGMYVWTSGNLVTENLFFNNQIGVLMSGDFNNLTSNFISKSDQTGLFLGINDPSLIPKNFLLIQNTFEGNKKQFSACVCEQYNESEPIHVWDNGKVGNYWSDYTGADSNGDGVGDTPYIIDEKNQDRYPLMAPTVKLPLEAAQPPYLLIGAVLATILLVVVGLVVFWKRKK